MNKDLEQFENRSDDWLAKQRNIENRTSAWDIDEGKRIKEYHEKNCEAKEIKERHERIHSGQIRPRKKNATSAIITVILVMIALDIIGDAFTFSFTFIPLVITIVIALTILSTLKKGRK